MRVEERRDGQNGVEVLRARLAYEEAELPLLGRILYAGKVQQYGGRNRRGPEPVATYYRVITTFRQMLLQSVS